MFYTYILANDKNEELYTGFTTDLKRRISEHNHGLNFSTKPDKPWHLVYYEACTNEKDALRRERYLKTTQGERLLKRRLKEYLYERRSKNSVNRNSTTG
jgi:putative endonuclease